MHINLDINAQYRYLLNLSHLEVRENSRCKFDNSLNLVLSTELSSVPKFTRRLIRWLLLPINAIHLRSILIFTWFLNPLSPILRNLLKEYHAIKFVQSSFGKMTIIAETQLIK